MVEATKAPAAEPVGIGAKLRQAHPWFEALAQKAKDAAVKRRRQTGRAKGPPLEPSRLVELADELEEIQRELNPLLTKRKVIVEQLLAHWAHSGIEEIESTLGKTLISLSFELGVAPEAIRKAVGDTVWQKVTERTIQASKLLAAAGQLGFVRDAIATAITVCKLKVSVIPPSSRRAKSGAANDEEADEDAA